VREISCRLALLLLLLLLCCGRSWQSALARLMAVRSYCHQLVKQLQL
jgi:hypothetical protein